MFKADEAVSQALKRAAARGRMKSGLLVTCMDPRVDALVHDPQFAPLHKIRRFGAYVGELDGETCDGS